MQTYSTELFPETLFVSREGERIYTTSRRVAFHFGKKHHHVLRAIRNMMLEIDDEVVNETNFGFIDTPKDGADTPKIGSISAAKFPDFELSHYRDGRNRKKPEYLLSHDGFLFLVMGFTGREAMRWKKVFVREFRRMEAELATLQARYVAVLDQVRPHLRLTVQDFEAGLSRQTTALKCGKSEAAITYRRSQARRFGLLPAAQRRTIFISNPEGVAA